MELNLTIGDLDLMKPMTAPSLLQFTKSFRGIGTRQVRLGCGLVLYLYLISHFLNHALGNISLEAMTVGVRYHAAFWHFPPIASVFYGSALVHCGLGFYALYQRRQFHWRAIEPLQLVLGLSIPALLTAHVVGARLGQSLYGQQKFYPQELYAFWVTHPFRIGLMSAVIVIAWIHGSIGLYFWLRLKPFFKSVAPLLLAIAVLIPTLALLGFYQSGRTVAAISGNPEWQAANLAPAQVGTPDQSKVLDDIADDFLIGYVGLIVLVLLAKAARALYERRAGMITLSYGNGRKIRAPKGLSVLEASLRNNVPHASMCGGRARCSTCRIRVIGDCGALPPPSQREAFVLDRVGATDPSIRLACQLRPAEDLSFFQLFIPQAMSANANASEPQRIGQERYLVSMFVDMRGSTQLAEQRLPFDTVFIVNRFLAAVSQAVIECGGQPNQFVGDGELALFGLGTSPQTACRQALKAAAMIAANIAELNQFLSHDLREPIRFGLGIHGGEVIIGDIGYRDHMVFTALGDAVNVAARLQDMTKTLACEAIFSEEVRITAGLSDDSLPAQEVSIRGRSEVMVVRPVTSAAKLSVLVEDLSVIAA
jgi:adenylate cyclase